LTPRIQCIRNSGSAGAYIATTGLTFTQRSEHSCCGVHTTRREEAYGRCQRPSDHSDSSETRSEFPTHVAGVLRSPGPPPVGKYARPVENARVTVRDASTALAGACACACARVRRHISAASLSRTIETDNVGRRADRRTVYYCVITSSRAVRLIKTCDDKTTRLRVILLSSSSPRSLFSPSVFSRVQQQQRVSGAAGHHVRRRDDNELLTNDIVDVSRNRRCRKHLVPLFLTEMIIRLQQPDSVSR